MTHNPPSPKLSLLPESAPFTPEQRAWLDGFFIAALGLADSGITPLSPQDAAAIMAGGAAPAAEVDDGAPWHDQTIPMAERMKLADGKPLRRRMMAAMGQQAQSMYTRRQGDAAHPQIAIHRAGCRAGAGSSTS
jgi:sulfite reductase (NADPH) flavoprotein alpha-component